MKKMIFRSVCMIAICSVIALSCTNRAGEQSNKAEYDFTFAFLTDIHVELAKNADKGFAAAINHVNGMKPDFVVTGGDLVADALGQTEETATKFYDLYIELSDKIKCPVYNTLGNHEEFGFYPRSGISRDHELYGDKMYESKIGPRYHAFNEKDWRFYILDSVEETPDRQYVGGIDSVQMAWIKSDLESVDPDMPIVIISHIPLLTSFSQIRGGSMAQNSRGLVVENSKAVLDAFEGHNLKLVLQGHLHILEEAYINDITFITGGAVCAKWWEGAKEGMEEGYVLLKVKGEEIDWEYIDYGWEAGSGQ
jgi:3',5'-cyclic-AMP phosphodiesterase